MGAPSSLPPSACDAALAAGTTINTSNTPPKPFLFNIDNEAYKASEGQTTLTPAQDHYEKATLALWDAIPPGSPPTSPDAQAFFSKLKSINVLPAEDQNAILGKLLYHSAHTQEIHLTADILGYCPPASNIQFSQNAHYDLSLGIVGTIIENHIDPPHKSLVDLIKTGAQLTTDHGPADALYSVPANPLNAESLPGLVAQVAARAQKEAAQACAMAH